LRPPESWRRARLTLAIAAVTALAWLLAEGTGYGTEVAFRAGFLPATVPQGLGGVLPFWLTPLTATVIHASFVHLAFNLIMLLFCGRSVEPILGPWGLLILYLLGAYVAAAAQFAAGPASLVPMVGASGAISAVMGAYALLFGRNKVKVKDPRLATVLNALWLGTAWVGLQILVGLTFANEGYSLAVAAHIGGVLVGLLLAKPLLLLRYRKA
jgi:membrane associated rhomboid family serine protease